MRLPPAVPAIFGALLYLAMALFGVAHKSGTFDEFVHVTAGYSYWTFDDYRLNPENGNWSQRLVALPLVAEGLGASAFPSRDQGLWRGGDMWSMSEQFFFAPNRNADALLFPARAVVAVIGALLGVLAFFWSRSLFGAAGAGVTLTLYVFSPTLLAHGALATSDMIGTAFFVAALWALWRLLHEVTPSTVAASALAVSGVFLAKPSGPVFIPIALAMVAVQLLSSRPVRVRLGRDVARSSRSARARLFAGLIALHVAVGFVLIWASYGFRYSFAPNGNADASFLDPWSKILDTPSLATTLASWGRVHHVLPEAYLYGLATVLSYAKDRVAFLNGSTTTGGTLAFFPYTLLYKTTIAGLTIAVLIPLVLIARRIATRRGTSADDSRSGLYELTPLLAAITIYGAFALSSSLNIGHRHLLPLIPLAMVLAGVVGEVAFDRAEALRRRGLSGVRPTVRTALPATVLTGLLIWHAGESLHIAPNYLAYFNAFAGGPSQGYRHLVDSSLDWGQDLPGLKEWLDRDNLQRGDHAPVYLSYFGTALPSFYGIEATPLIGFPDRWSPHEPEPLTPGVYCFSATMLQGVYLLTRGPWTEQYEKDYESMLHNLQLFDSTATNPRARAALLKQTGEPFWVKNFQIFEHLRTARLAAYLRRREPDAEIGYSILIYRVGDAELATALYGPPPQ